MSGSVCNCTDILADVSDGSSGDSDYDDDSTNLVNDLHKISPVPMPLVLGKSIGVTVAGISPVPMPLVLGRSIGVTVAGLSNSVSSVLIILHNKTDRLCFIAYFLIY